MRTDGIGADPIVELLDQAAASVRASGPAGPTGRRDFLRALTVPYDPLRTAVEPAISESAPGDGYRRDRVELEFLTGLPGHAYVLIPDGLDTPAPAVIAVHGHGYGSRQIIGLRPDGSPLDDDHDGYHRFAVELARRGLIVIAPEVVGFGERRSEDDQAYDAEADSSCYRLATTLLMQGATLAGLRVAELLGLVGYVAGRADVDANRIGIVGHSGGATLSMIVSALDERIGATVLSGYPNTFAASIRAVRHCACNYLPGVLRVAELPDLLELLAPRPLFLESGERDPIFPRAGFEQAVRQVTGAYTAAGAAARLESDLHPGGHEVSGRRSFDWLAHTLTG
jgi:dienelactone hydrolase